MATVEPLKTPAVAIVADGAEVPACWALNGKTKTGARSNPSNRARDLVSALGIVFRSLQIPFEGVLMSTYVMQIPPSTGITTPFTYAPALDAR
jgi:hypothetical protein